MENQHRKISGYRDLSQKEIDMMNSIKKLGGELLALQAELVKDLHADYATKLAAASAAQKDTDATAYLGESEEALEFRRFFAAEPQRWAAIGKSDIETGIMALVRAVAQPAPL